MCLHYLRDRLGQRMGCRYLAVGQRMIREILEIGCIESARDRVPVGDVDDAMPGSFTSDQPLDALHAIDLIEEVNGVGLQIVKGDMRNVIGREHGSGQSMPMAGIEAEQDRDTRHEHKQQAELHKNRMHLGVRRVAVDR